MARRHKSMSILLKNIEQPVQLIPWDLWFKNYSAI